LDLENIPVIRILNKKDLVDQSLVSQLERTFEGIGVSAFDIIISFTTG
jgi:50S ribosomal subunit-associated GTPase HflX